MTPVRGLCLHRHCNTGKGRHKKEIGGLQGAESENKMHVRCIPGFASRRKSGAWADVIMVIHLISEGAELVHHVMSTIARQCDIVRIHLHCAKDTLTQFTSVPSPQPFSNTHISLSCLLPTRTHQQPQTHSSIQVPRATWPQAHSTLGPASN